MPTLNLRSLQQQLHDHLQRQQPEFAPHDLRLLAHGEANVIFRLNQTAIVRVAVNTPNRRFEGDFCRVTQFEHSVLQYLQGTAIGHTLQQAQLTPSEDFSYTYLITNYLEGTALDYSRSHLDRCAQTLARLHRLPLSEHYAIDRLMGQVAIVAQPLTLFYQEAQAYAQPYLDSPEAEPEIIEMLQAVLQQAKARLVTEPRLEQYPHLCLVHSDHTYENWVIGSDRAYLIDWEWAELGSPAGDLGHFLSPVTIVRRQGYQLPASDRAYFLERYYEALDDPTLAETIQQHFAVFGVFPAVRSLCWTAGYWITANRWYADAETDSAIERIARLDHSRQQFPALWQAVMAWLEAE